MIADLPHHQQHSIKSEMRRYTSPCNKYHTQRKLLQAMSRYAKQLLIKQVQLATDFAKGPASRLAGIDIPKYADEEKTCLLYTSPSPRD